MTENDEKLLYNDAYSKWGMRDQLDMVQEECAELIQAVSKVKRSETFHITDNFIEEIADVKIMLAQMEFVFGIRDEVEKVRKYKIERLRKKVYGIDA